MLPRNAKLYITATIASGLVVLLLAARSWSPSNLKQFGIFLGLAALASTLKIRIPGIESTLTPNFVFLLLAISFCDFPQVVIISLVAAITQSLWRSAKRPRLVQVAFNAAVLVLSASAAYWLSHLLAEKAWSSAIGVVILAGCVYFPLNSALVAMVIGLASGQSLGEICRRRGGWLIPYFVGGIIFAAVVTPTYNQSVAWKSAAILIPAVILAHLYFQNRFTQKFAAKSSA